MFSFLSNLVYWKSNHNVVQSNIEQKVNLDFQNNTTTNNIQNHFENELLSISELTSSNNLNYIESISEFNYEIDNNSKNNSSSILSNELNSITKPTHYESQGEIIYETDSNENAESYKIGWKFINNNKNRSYYCCIYHIQCNRKRSFQTTNGKLVIREYGQEHANQINNEIAISIMCEEYTHQIMHMTSLQAQSFILNKLRDSKLFSEEDIIKKYILTTKQIENMRNRLKSKNNKFSIISNNGELIIHLNNNITSTKDEYDLKSASDVILLDKYYGSISNNNSGMCLGFSFTTKGLLETIKEEINKPISLYVDGTWKLLANRWVLLILSYQVIRRNDNKELVQSSRPFMFAISYSESESGVNLLINSFINAGIYYYIIIY